MKLLSIKCIRLVLTCTVNKSAQSFEQVRGRDNVQLIKENKQLAIGVTANVSEQNLTDGTYLMYLHR